MNKYFFLILLFTALLTILYNWSRQFLLLGDFHLRKGVVWHEYIWDTFFDDCVWSTCCYDYRYKKIVTRLPKLWWLFFSCYSLEATHWSELPFCTFIIKQFQLVCQSWFFSVSFTFFLSYRFNPIEMPWSILPWQTKRMLMVVWFWLVIRQISIYILFIEFTIIL